MRFVLVNHPQRGTIILLCTDLQLDPVEVIMLYAYHYKIELSFRHALHVIGVCSYHFWMLATTQRDRGVRRQKKDTRRLLTCLDLATGLVYT